MERSVGGLAAHVADIVATEQPALQGTRAGLAFASQVAHFAGRGLPGLQVMIDAGNGSFLLQEIPALPLLNIKDGWYEAGLSCTSVEGAGKGGQEK